MQRSFGVRARTWQEPIHGLERGSDYWDDEDLRLQLDHRGCTVVGQQKWRRFTLRLRQDSCYELTEFGYELNMAMAQSFDGLGRIVTRTFREQGAFERLAAAQCVKRMADLRLSDPERISAAVHALGVFACLMQGIRLEVCRCAQPWLRGSNQRAARAVIARALPLIPGPAG